MIDALRVKAFRSIWGSIGLASTGMFSVIVISGTEANRLTHSPLWTSVIFASVLGPSIFVSPFAGAFADRHHRGRVMTFGLLTGAVGCVFLAVGAAVHLLNLGWLIGGTLLVGSGRAIQAPAWQAILPGILGRRRLLNGSALMRVASQGGEFVGPAVVTAVLVGIGAVEAYLLAAFFFVLGVGLTLLIRIPSAVSQVRRASVAEGYRYLRQRWPLSPLLALVGCHCSLTMAYIGLLPILADRHLGGGDSYGWLVTGVGLGAMGGSLILAGAARRLDPARGLLITGVLSGLTMVWLGLAAPLGAALAGAVAVGASQAVFMAVLYSVVQNLTAEPLRARVASFSNVLTAGTMSILSLAWGALALVIAPGLVMTATGLLFVLLVVVFVVSWLPPLLRKDGFSDDLSDQPPTTTEGSRP